MLDSNFTQQRVLVVGEDSLFDQGVTRFLAQRTDFVLSRTKFSGEHVFPNTIKQDDLPDVILVCESGLLDTTHILDLISSHAMAMKLLVVVIRLRNNVIDVYERPMNVAGMMMYIKSQQIIAGTKDDLLNVIRRKHKALRESSTYILQN